MSKHTHEMKERTFTAAGIGQAHIIFELCECGARRTGVRDATPVNGASNPTVYGHWIKLTGVNLFALADLVRRKSGALSFHSKVEVTDRMHIKRCMTAGYVLGSADGGGLYLTAIGKEAVIAYFKVAISKGYSNNDSWMLALDNLSR